MYDNDALWYTAPGEIQRRAEKVPEPGPGEVLVRALHSGISRGTERLVLGGHVPQSEYLRMRCPRQEGEFPFPVKYGYALVGTVTEGPPALKDRNVFLLHPHQRLTTVPLAAVHPLPAGLPPRRACLTANMETALNVTWDAELAPGQKILIVGGGVLGMLIAALAASVRDNIVTVVDVMPSRAVTAAAMGARFTLPHAAPADQDVVIHTSATEKGLALALDRAGFEARVVEASWFGNRPIQLPLGGAFHAQRLKLISSQVGAVAPTHRAKVSHAQRLAMAMELLSDAKFDRLITNEMPFSEAPSRLPAVLAGDSSDFMTVLRY